MTICYSCGNRKIEEEQSNGKPITNVTIGKAHHTIKNFYYKVLNIQFFYNNDGSKNEYEITLSF